MVLLSAVIYKIVLAASLFLLAFCSIGCETDVNEVQSTIESNQGTPDIGVSYPASGMSFSEVQKAWGDAEVKRACSQNSCIAYLKGDYKYIFISDNLEGENAVLYITLKKAGLNQKLSLILNKSYDEAVEAFGEVTVSDWWNGPIYKHDKCDYWFGYSNLDKDYNLTGDSVINNIICTAGDVFNGTELYNIDFSNYDKNYNEAEQAWYVTIECENLLIEVMCNENGEINERSLTYVISKDSC